MDFREVLRRRRMVRTYLDRPIDRQAVDRILAAATRGPSAGFSQGISFLVLEGAEETGRFWRAVDREEPGWPGEGLTRAPLLMVPLAGRQVYLDRYAEPDKGWTDRDQARWPVPYWLVDTAFASMLVLLAAVDEGLGALFFGLDARGYEALRGAFGVPAHWEPIGVIAVGHPGPDTVGSSARTRARMPPEEIFHRGAW